ncbi:hypothetical protein K8089_10885 [Aequorivita sp. F47161]|uniref:Uncharacterized protein n=1 Tax=Aequorivita vitellina TaxID=2874475 RepID=A0A9X1QXB3_9FLAO|nr:hypothetical protein [Aequorivita vitellina]MCG2419529.1 hypothetical protein [Aequorivita vitellina]
METKTHPITARKLALKEIGSILQKHCALVSLYCFGIHCNSNTKHDIMDGKCASENRHDHFYLFACVEKLAHNATANLMDIVATETKGRYTCTLLIHTYKQIAKAQPEQKHFYKDILEKAWLIAGEELDAEKLILTDIPEKNEEGIKKYVSDRNKLASSLLIEMEEHVETLLLAVTMHDVLELLLLSGIYSRLQYYPNHFHLKYLFGLFQFCHPIPDYIFPASLFEQDQYQEILNANHNDLRFRSKNLFEREDVLTVRTFVRHLYNSM